MFTIRSFRKVGRKWSDAVHAALPLALGASPLLVSRIIHLFREAGAITPASAQPFRAHSQTEAAAVLHLRDLGVIREPERGRYYLDEQELRKWPLAATLPWWW